MSTRFKASPNCNFILNSTFSNNPVFLTSPVIRRDLSNLIRNNIEDLNVLSFTELPENRKVQVIATIENTNETEKNNEEK